MVVERAEVDAVTGEAAVVERAQAMWGKVPMVLVAVEVVVAVAAKEEGRSHT